MEKQNHKAFRIALAAAFAILLIIALIYFTGVVYFSTHFPFNTYFLGYDISQCRQSAIDEIMQSESDARTLTVLEMDGAQEVIKLSYAVGYRRLVSEPEGGWIPENAGFRWPLSLYETSDLTRTEAITYSEDMVDDAVAALRAMDPANITEPQDARLEWQDDVCVIVPEVDGNELYPDRVENAIRSAIEGDLDFIDLAAEDCYKKADIRSDNEDIVQVYSRYAAINFQKIEIDMTGETITLSPDDVLSFFTGSPAKFILDADAVSEFVQGLKDRYDTYERERPFVNHYGNEITVGTRADTYGFKMDLDATTALLTETLEGHERLAQIKPVWINEAWARRENGCDIGDTYIEVSIADQYLWAYSNGEQVLSTPVVTGNLGNHSTPRGVFRILYMQRDATLVGEDYSSPVSFWMPLTWSGIGLHDASWRSNFGGSIYTYNGSHGCINMPYWAASSLYWTYYAGTPVVIW